MSRQRYVIVSYAFRTLVGLVTIAIALGIFAALVKTRPQPGRSDRGGEARRVVVMAARPVEVVRAWDGYGTARSMDEINVPARVTATVASIPDAVQDGAAVRAGALLVRLDPTDFTRQAEIARQNRAEIDTQLAQLGIEEPALTERLALASEQVTLAVAEYERIVAARAQNVAKDREVDQARQAVVSANQSAVTAREELAKIPQRRARFEAARSGLESRLRIAQQDLERCSITSPIDGVVTAVDVEPGENVLSGSRVAHVLGLGRIEVPVRLPAAAMATVRVGADVVLRATDDTERRWRSTVARIRPDVDAETRTMVAFVVIEQDPDARGGVAPGQFLRATIMTADAASRWVVPRRALDGERVLLVRDGQLEGRAIEPDFEVEARFPELGVRDVQWVVLREPLAAGDLVVLNVSRTLAEGMPVTPVVAGAGDDGAPVTAPEPARIAVPAGAAEVRP